MTVPLATQQDIREMDARGVPRAEISRGLGVSRNTVAKHAGMESMSPTPPVPARRARPAVDAYAAWVGSVLEADLGAPRKQRRTAKRIYDRMADELGCAGSYPSVSRCVARWKSEHPPASLRDGYLELERAPGTAQADSGNFRRVLAGRPRDMKLLAMALPHSNARRCAATFSERSGCPCGGLRGTFEQIGRAPSPLVLDNATEAGRMVRGEVTESRLFSQSRAHCRCASRHCSPCSGNGKGSVENAVGLPRRNLPEPEPEPSVSSLAELNGTLRGGCERVNAPSRRRDGRPVGEALAEDPAAMLALPGAPLDAVRWARAKSDRRGCVGARGSRCCAGPARHDRGLLVGLRAGSVETLADRGRSSCSATSRPRLPAATPPERASLLRRRALPAPKTFDGYGWTAVSWPEGFGREGLLSPSFLEAREDLVLMGDAGTGKTHMASALRMMRCEAKIEARFFAASSLVMRLRRANVDGRLDRELSQIGRADLLAVDEPGFPPLDAKARGRSSRWCRRPTRRSLWPSPPTWSSRDGARRSATTRWPRRSPTGWSATAGSCASGESRTG